MLPESEVVALRPWAEIAPGDEAVLAAAFDAFVRTRAPVSGSVLRFEQRITQQALDSLRDKQLLTDRGGDGWRPTVLGALYVPDALPLLSAIDSLLKMANTRYRPGGVSLDAAAIREVVGDAASVPAELLGSLLGDLGWAFDATAGTLSVGERALDHRSLGGALVDQYGFRYRGNRADRAPLPPAPFTVRVRRLRAIRFRALQDISCDLGPLTVVVGPNGVGKSTLLALPAFVAAALTHGLADTLERQGGFGRVRSKGTHGPLEIGIDFSVTYPSGDTLAGSYTFACADLHGTTVVERERLVVVDEGSSRALIDGTRGRARLLGSDGTVDVAFHAAGDLALARQSDEQKYPLAVYLREALRRVASIEPATSATRARFGWAVGEAQASAHTPDLLQPIIDSGELVEKLGSLMQALVPRLRGVKRVVVTGELPSLEFEEHDMEGSLRLDELSTGTRQMLLLAAAYLHPRPPPLLLVEEPDGGIHAGAHPALVDLLRSLATRMTVLVTSHSPAFVRLLDPRDEVRALERTQHGVTIRPLADAIASRAWVSAFHGDEGYLRSTTERQR